MSILESMRQSTDSLWTRVFMGAIAVGFISFMGGNGNDVSASVVATVNGEEISVQEFRSLARRIGRGRELSDEQRAQVLEGLIQRAVLRQEAERLGLAVGDGEVAARVKLAFSQFVKDGTLDRKAYEEFLKAQGLDHATVLRQIREELLLERLQGFVDAAVDVPEAELRAAWEKQTETWDLTFVRVSTTNLQDTIEVSAKDRKAYIAAHADAIKKRYDESFERTYNLPRRLALSTILLRTDLPGSDEAGVRAKLETIRAQAESGAPFADLARTWSEEEGATNGGERALQAVAQLEPELVAAADAAGEGKVTGIVKTPQGLVIALVRDVVEAEVVPLEAARDAIATQLIREERAPARVATFVEELRAEWTDAAAPPAAMLEGVKLAARSTGAFSLADLEGSGPTGAQPGEIPELGVVPGLLDAVKAAAPGTVIPGTWDVRGTATLVALTAHQTPDDSGWENEKRLVRAMQLRQARAAHAEQWVNSLVAQATVVRAGGSEPAKP